MRWIFDHFGLIVFFAIAYSVWQKAKKFLAQAGDEANRQTTTRRAANYDPEDADRVRRVQEEIRRKIAERRGGEQRTPGATRTTDAPPVIRPARVPPTDPFGGSPMGRVFTEIERRLQPAPATPVAESRNNAAQLERQAQLTEQMRVLEESRKLVERRAAQVAAATQVQAASGAGLRAVSRGNLLAELRDPRSLRRAFVLREVLGTPVGLR